MFGSIKGLCFDLFNTLVDVGQVPLSVGAFTADILEINHQRWREACFSLKHDITRPTDGYTCLRELVHSIAPEITDEKIREAAQVRQRRFEHALLNVDEKVLCGLSRLQAAGYKLALVSNAASSEVQAWKRSPLAVYFDTAVFSCDVGSRKPEAEIYQHALNSLGLSAAECLFVGDGGSQEHHGASAVGMKPVLLTHYLDGDRAIRVREECQAVLTAEAGDLTELLACLGMRPD